MYSPISTDDTGEAVLRLGKLTDKTQLTNNKTVTCELKQSDDRNYLNSFLDPDAARLSRLASADALFSAASLGFAFALFSFALIFFKAAFSPLVSAAAGAGIL